MAKKEKLLDNNPPNELKDKNKEKRARLKKEKRQQRRQLSQEQRSVENGAAQKGEDGTGPTEDELAAVSCPEVQAVEVKSGSEAVKRNPYTVLWEQYTPAPQVLIRGADWHTQRPGEKREPKVLVDLTVRKQLKDLAAQIYKNELLKYDMYEENSGSREARFRRQILSHGAAKDRVAAHILRLTESPLHSLTHFNQLVSFIASNKDSQIKEISKSLEDVLRVSLLPKSMVAKQFEAHDFHSLLLPVVRSGDRNRAYRLLLVWYFEDQLKTCYSKLITTLQEVVQSSSESTKLKAVQLLLHLLNNHPQQDTYLMLQVLVNKLGDLEKKVAISVVFGLRNLLIRRPELKSNVVDTCGEFLYRSNQRGNHLYNCMLLLKDILFTKNDGAVVTKMVKLYFGFFKACTKKGEVDNKLMSVILRGLNRAMPYLPSSGTGEEGSRSGFLGDQLDTLYKMCHLVSFNISVQILQLLYQVMVSVEGPLTERFHRVLYERLLCRELAYSSAVASFLNIVFKTMNRMTNPLTLKAFTKRLLQVAHHLNTCRAMAILYTVREVEVENPLLAKVVDGMTVSPNDGLDAAALTQEVEKLKDEAMKEEKEASESLVPAQESVVNPLARRSKSQQHQEEEEDSDREYFEDLDVGPDGKPVLVKGKSEQQKLNGAVPSSITTNIVIGATGSSNSSSTTNKSGGQSSDPKRSWQHRDTAELQCKQELRNTVYDPYHRNPTYCGAQAAPMWEFWNMTRHFHPSVRKFTEKILEHENLDYTGDPLIDFSNIKFLDRFIYKNPKTVKINKQNGGGVFLGDKSQYSADDLRSMSVATDSFKSLKEEKVPEDAVFMHRYFSKYSLQALNEMSRRAKKKLRLDEDDGVGDDNGVDDDEFDEYLKTIGGKDGELQDAYAGDEDLDDQWDFAAKATPSGAAKDEDSDEDEFGGSDDDDFAGGDDVDDEEGDISGEDLNEDDADFEFDGDSDDENLYLDEDEDEAAVGSSKGVKQTAAKKKKKSEDVEVSSEKKKKSVKRGRDVEEDETLDGEDDGSDWGSYSDGEDGLDEDFSDEYSIPSTTNKKRKLDQFTATTAPKINGRSSSSKKSKSLSFGGRSLESMMMDADDFSRILQKNESNAPAITSQDYVNTGKTSTKQLSWERSKEGRSSGGRNKSSFKPGSKRHSKGSAGKQHKIKRK